MKLLKACLPLVAVLLWASCQSGGWQPVVLDLSATTPTPGAAETATPSPRPPAPTATVAPPRPSPAAPPSPTPAPAPMQPQPVQPVEIRAPKPGSPEAVVQSRIDAYNSRDIEKLLSLYAADARIFDPPDRVRDTGAEQIRQTLVRRFASTQRTRIDSDARMTSGNFVVSRETETSPSGAVESSIVITEVLDGKIVRVWILR